MIPMSRDIARAEPEKRRQRIRLYRRTTLGAILAIALGLGITLLRGAWDLALIIGLAAILIADFLIGTARLLSQERTYRLTETRLCRDGDCRPLAEIKRAELKTVYFSFQIGPFLGLLLDFGDTRWWMPFSLRNWETVWDGLDRARPDLGLGDWRRHRTLRRTLAWGMRLGVHTPPEIIERPQRPLRGLLIGLGTGAAVYFAVTRAILPMPNLPDWAGVGVLILVLTLSRLVYDFQSLARLKEPDHADRHPQR